MDVSEIYLQGAAYFAQHKSFQKPDLLFFCRTVKYWEKTMRIGKRVAMRLEVNLVMSCLFLKIQRQPEL